MDIIILQYLEGVVNGMNIQARITVSSTITLLRIVEEYFRFKL